MYVAKWAALVGTLLGVCVSLQSTALFAAPQRWEMVNGGNGHYYDLVTLDNPVDWHAARLEATKITPPLGYLTGHLVTISDAAENEFLTAAFGSDIIGGFYDGAWFGFTDEDVEGEWRWIDSTPGVWFDPDNFPFAVSSLYVNWAGGEPNDSQGPVSGEDYGSFRPDGSWNDFENPERNSPQFIVEFSPIPEPATRTLAAIAVLLLVVQRLRPRCFCRSSFALAFLACLALVPASASAKPPRGGYGGIPARYGPEWRAQQAGTYTQVWVNSPNIGTINYGTWSGGFNRWGGVGPGWGYPVMVQPMPMFWGPTYAVPTYNWPTYQYYRY